MEGETDEKVVWGRIIRACIHLLSAAMLTEEGQKPSFYANCRHDYMCTSPGSAAHSKMRGKSESVSLFFFFFIGFCQLLLLKHFHEHAIAGVPKT